ncbi:MAG: tetratricopeptide repeat protein [Candidatus Binatia bacterium]
MPSLEKRNSNFEIGIWNFPYSILLFPLVLFLFSCESELIRKQEEEIRRQQREITRQRQEIEELRLAKLKMEQKRQDCNRAFRDFEKAQKVKDPDRAIGLYREGLKLCPDDDVAHYELGKILIGIGRSEEAEEEFETALRINPDFQAARQELNALQKRK